MHNVIVIGAGHNGLTAAFYLAKAGLKPLVLERRGTVGGGAITSELHPGFRVPTLSHHLLLWADIARDMALQRHGVELLKPDAEVFAPGLDGRALTVYDDPKRSADAIRPFSTSDADAYPEYRRAVGRVTGVLASLFTSPPPSIDQPGPRDIWNLLGTGRKFRSLGHRDGYRLLRWGPMPVADLMAEWFETDLLSAAVAAPGLSGTMFGPRSAGSALVLLMHETHRQLAGGALRVRGGPGALTLAMADAARAAGAEIRTGVPVDRILTIDERVTGVMAGGAEIAASTVVSALDPKTTFLRLMDPVDLSPEFVTQVRNFRAAGTVAKINLALSALPVFTGGADAQALSGRIHVGPGLNYLERAFDHAKYGEPSADPWLDITIPSILDPQLAPAGAHVMSIYVHYSPATLRGSDWDAAAGPLLQRVLRTIERFAPGLSSLVAATQVITPRALERDFGFHGGHIFHGELALDQLFTMRPLLGYGRYDSPIRGLYLCGAGTHPGGFMTGASGRLAAAMVRDA
ncbi:MAG TPA: NAD(P)/FAD-dependent oxidoreductase [Vicinamibacterales bacterium]